MPDAVFRKMAWPERDAKWPAGWQPIGDGDVIAAVSNYGYAGNAGGMRMAIAESHVGKGVSVLSQAKAMPQSVLKLLG